MTSVLLVNNPPSNCGVQEWGIRTGNMLTNSIKYNFVYRECDSAQRLYDAIKEVNPSIIMYNYNPATLPWLNSSVMYKIKNRKNVVIIHEGFAHHTDTIGFDYYIYLPKNIPIGPKYHNKVFKIGRTLIKYNGLYPVNTIPTIGSFGFGFDHKRYELIAETVNKEFDEAVINFSMAYSAVGDPRGDVARRTTQNCRNLITKPGIQLNVSHDFLKQKELLTFLAGNDINCFFYDYSKIESSSGSTDYALSVKRPIAVTKSNMFVHLTEVVSPSICIEDRTLKEIIASGIEPLQPLYDKWSDENFIKEFEYICDRILHV
jgi:hypothetical protein